MTGKEALNKLQHDFGTLKENELLECFKAIDNELDEKENYKKIEEEFGIDLITLFKALREGIYIKERYVIYESCPEVVGDEHCFYYSEKDSYVHFEDYGKTWALTKEELEYA